MTNLLLIGSDTSSVSHCTVCCWREAAICLPPVTCRAFINKVKASPKEKKSCSNLSYRRIRWKRSSTNLHRRCSLRQKNSRHISCLIFAALYNLVFGRLCSPFVSTHQVNGSSWGFTHKPYQSARQEGLPLSYRFLCVSWQKKHNVLTRWQPESQRLAVDCG